MVLTTVWRLQWFDDKKDGVHTGDYNDPRVVCIQIVPDEIRYVSTLPTPDHAERS